MLTFLGDSSQLDQVFARIPAQAAESMGAAATSVGQVGTAFEGVNFELDATASNVPFCGETIKDAMGVAGTSTREAQGEVMLLGELFGIHLPRHVSRFVAGLPEVSAALQGAFAATAVVFLVEALVKIIEKISDFANSAKEIEQAWEAVDKVQSGVFENLETNLIRAELKTAELTNNYMEALRLKLQLIDRTDLSALAGELQKIATAADAAFVKMDRNWFGKLLGMEGAEGAKKQFDDVGKAVTDALSVKTPESFSNAMKLVDTALAEAGAKVKTLEEAMAKFNAQREAAEAASAGHPVNVGLGPDPRTIESWQKLSTVLQDYKKDIEAAEKVEQDEKKNTNIEDRAAAAQRATKALNEEFKLYADIAKAHENLDKLVEKGADDVAKVQTSHLTQQLKEEESASKEELKLLNDRLKAAIASLDGEVKATEDAATRKELAYKRQFDRGLLSGKQYLAALKQLQDKELQDLTAILDRKEQLVILEAQNEAAKRGQILTAANAKELKGYIDLETQKMKYTDQFTARFEKDQESVVKATKLVKQAYTEEAQAFATATEAMITGQESFAQAMEASTLKMLANIAKHYAEIYIAKGIGNLADMNWGAAAGDFAAAAAFEVIGGALAGAGSNIGQAAKGAGTAASTATVTPSTSTAAAGVGPATVNVPKLFSGAIVTQPTLAMIGDREGGGSRAEGVFPLGDPRAKQALMDAFGINGGTATNHNYYINGMISTTDLTRLTRVISRGANTGRVRMSVTNSNRITRRT